MQRIDAGIQRAVFYRPQGTHFAVAAVAHDGTRRLRALFQRQPADLIGISKTRFLAADRTNADALVNVIRTIFNDAVFQNPGFVIARLKIEIAVIQTALGQLAKNGKKILMIQAIC